MPTVTTVGAVPRSSKKRTGLIVGLVAAAVFLMIILILALVYFLWWQNPKKMVTDGVLGLATAEKVTAAGLIKLTTGGHSFNVNISARTAAGGSAAEMAITVRPQGMTQDYKAKLDGVVAKNGDIYFKVSQLEKLIDIIVESYTNDLSANSSDYGMLYSEEMIAQMRSHMKQMFEPIVKKVDNQWIRFSPKDASDNPEYKCYNETLANLQTDKRAQEALKRAFRDHDPLVISNTKVPSRNGGYGFEIDLGSVESQQKIKDFSRAVEQTDFGKKLKNCGSSSDSDDLSDVVEKPRSVKLRLWVHPLTHKLVAAAGEVTEPEDDSKLEFLFDFSVGRSQPVEAPKDAKSFDEVSKDVQSTMSGLGFPTAGLSYDDGPVDDDYHSVN